MPSDEDIRRYRDEMAAYEDSLILEQSDTILSDAGLRHANVRVDIADLSEERRRNMLADEIARLQIEVSPLMFFTLFEDVAMLVTHLNRSNWTHKLISIVLWAHGLIPDLDVSATFEVLTAIQLFNVRLASVDEARETLDALAVKCDFNAAFNRACASRTQLRSMKQRILAYVIDAQAIGERQRITAEIKRIDKKLYSSIHQIQRREGLKR